MKIGDLVSVRHHLDGKVFIGLVVNLDLDDLQEARILWNDEKIQWEMIEQLEVINESR